MNKVRLAIAGSTGRMGKMLIEASLSSSECALAAALARTGSVEIGQDAGLCCGKHAQVLISDQIEQALVQADCIIDFTRPESTMQWLELAKTHHKSLVIGTTGFTSQQKRQIEDAAKHIPIVFSPNMAIGVNILFYLIHQASRYLYPQFDTEILESHHRHKVDAPSGTALKMGEIIAQQAGETLDTHAVYTRHGHTGERKKGSIGFSAVRAGDIIGDHTVLFAGAGERIELTHRSNSRLSYAEGALKAAVFLQDKKQGFFQMQDVLGLDFSS